MDDDTRFDDPVDEEELILLREIAELGVSMNGPFDERTAGDFGDMYAEVIQKSKEWKEKYNDN